MLRIVTSNNGEVFRHLGSATFRRLDLEHKVASDGRALLALVGQTRPDIVLIDAQLPDQSGFELARTIKQSPELAGTRVILLLSNMISRPELDGLAESQCDDVLVLPISADDFYHHLATVAGLPVRRTPRIGIELRMEGDGNESIVGTVMNVNAVGLGVRTSKLLQAGTRVRAGVRFEGERCELSGVVAWARAGSDGEPGFLAGIELDSDIPIRARMVLEQLSLFDLSPERDETDLPGALVVVMQGDFTEAIDFQRLAERLAGERRIVFDMAGVRYISSAGVKAWSNLIALLDGVEYVFRHCSVAFASQLAMVPMVLGDGHVISLETPYYCPSCQRDDLRLLETKALLREGTNIIPPSLRCPTCGGELEFDDVPNRYFAFLRQE